MNGGNMSLLSFHSVMHPCSQLRPETTSSSSTSSESGSPPLVSLSSPGAQSYLDAVSNRKLASPSTLSSCSSFSASSSPWAFSPSAMASATSLATSSAGISEDAASLPKPNPKHVLLMLDMQKFMLEEQPVGVPAAKTVYQNLAQVLAHARASPHPPLIIHVRNTGDPGEPDEPESDGWQLIFDPLPNEVVIDKRKNNAFAGTTLGSYVAPDAEMVVVGFQTDFSVRATCSAALGRGNEVILLKEAHATFDRIEVLHGGGITPAAAIEAEIEAELEEAGVHIFEMRDLRGIFEDR